MHNKSVVDIKGQAFRQYTSNCPFANSEENEVLSFSTGTYSFPGYISELKLLLYGL